MTAVAMPDAYVGRASTSRLELELREMLEENPTAMRLAAKKKLEAGDPQFWKMFLDRLWPVNPVDLPAGSEGAITFAWKTPPPEELVDPVEVAQIVQDVAQPKIPGF